MTLPEFKGGERVVLMNGLVVEIVKIGKRKVRLSSEFDEPLYAIKYPPHEKNGWKYPESIGTQLWDLTDLGEIVAEVLSTDKPKDSEAIRQRIAQCLMCGKEVLSSPELPFFQRMPSYTDAFVCDQCQRPNVCNENAVD